MSKISVYNKIDTIIDNGNNTADRVKSVLKEMVDFSEDGANANAASIALINSSLATVTNEFNTLNEHVQDDVDVSISAIETDILAIKTKIENIEDKLDLFGLPFRYWTAGAPVKDKNNNSLWYSFDGIEAKSINLTFKFKMGNVAEKAPNEDHMFDLDAQLMNIINGILNSFSGEENRLTFVISSRSIVSSRVAFRQWTMTLNQFVTGTGASQKRGINLKFYSNTADSDLLKAGEEVFTSIQFHCPKFALESSIPTQ